MTLHVDTEIMHRRVVGDVVILAISFLQCEAFVRFVTAQPAGMTDDTAFIPIGDIAGLNEMTKTWRSEEIT